jgi:hypothetical protein
MTPYREGRPVAITAVFWATIATGLCLPGLVEILTARFRHGAAWGVAVDDWWSHLFLPGYNGFLLAAIQSVPFVVFAVFNLFRLARGWDAGEKTFRNSLTAAIVGPACGGSLSLWGLASIAASRSSTAAIGYLFLPLPVSVVLVVGYFAGMVLGLRRS